VRNQRFFPRTTGSSFAGLFSRQSSPAPLLQTPRAIFRSLLVLPQNPQTSSLNSILLRGNPQILVLKPETFFPTPRLHFSPFDVCPQVIRPPRQVPNTLSQHPEQDPQRPRHLLCSLNSIQAGFLQLHPMFSNRQPLSKHDFIRHNPSFDVESTMLSGASMET
jgi:hypothetical protein